MSFAGRHGRRSQIRQIGIALVFVAAVTLAAPPTIHADSCYTYPNRYIGYFADCGCTACAGWAMTNCTECVSDDGSSSCQTTGTVDDCGPLYPNHNPNP
jgi:hypothetical protein